MTNLIAAYLGYTYRYSRHVLPRVKNKLHLYKCCRSKIMSPSGPENVEEYVRYYTDKSSPYMKEIETLVREHMIKEWDQIGGVCTILVHVTQRYEMGKALVARVDVH